MCIGSAGPTFGKVGAGEVLPGPVQRLGRCALPPAFLRLAERYPEVAAACSYFKFAGRRQRETPVADAKTLVQIILLLPGEPFLNRPHDAPPIEDRNAKGPRLPRGVSVLRVARPASPRFPMFVSAAVVHEFL